MNERQKEVISASLDDEKEILAALEKNYTAALADIKRNIKALQANPLTQAKAYQLDFQKQLEKQISGILDNLSGKNFSSIAEYLNTCYRTGFVGTMYDLQGQGIPLILPMDQEQILKAVQKTSDDIKLANKVGVCTNDLKKQVLEEMKRGFATELSYADIARNISNRGQANMGRAMTIARTEGHRVQNEAKMDSYYAAKAKGADIVKQWDATLDSSTRETHRMLDGQVRELDEDFTVMGASAPYPGGFGDPAEDCNCRCCMLQRARWAVEGETTYDKWNNETGGIIQCSGFEEFKGKYLDAADALTSAQNGGNINYTFPPVETSTSKALKSRGVVYNEVAAHQEALTDDEIIRVVSGGDMTTGSCASAALAYVGQKHGWDVLDFRGGKSMDYFSSKRNKVKMFKELGAKSIVSKSAKSSLTNGKRILGQLQEGVEYYLSVGGHAAIVRKKNGVLQYLELQSSRPEKNGWTDFGDVASTLQRRFRCSPSSSFYSAAYATDISQLSGDDFRTILGYINTYASNQRKGAAGSAK